MMKAMPLTAGSASRSFRQASRPPAEAPMATTGNSSVLLAERGFDIQRDRFPSIGMIEASRHSEIFLEERRPGGTSKKS